MDEHVDPRDLRRRVRSERLEMDLGTFERHLNECGQCEDALMRLFEEEDATGAADGLDIPNDRPPVWAALADAGRALLVAVEASPECAERSDDPAHLRTCLRCRWADLAIPAPTSRPPLYVVEATKSPESEQGSAIDAQTKETTKWDYPERMGAVLAAGQDDPVPRDPSIVAVFDHQGRRLGDVKIISIEDCRDGRNPHFQVGRDVIAEGFRRGVLRAGDSNIAALELSAGRSRAWLTPDEKEALMGTFNGDQVLQIWLEPLEKERS